MLLACTVTSLFKDYFNCPNTKPCAIIWKWAIYPDCHKGCFPMGSLIYKRKQYLSALCLLHYQLNIAFTLFFSSIVMTRSLRRKEKFRRRILAASYWHMLDTQKARRPGCWKGSRRSIKRNQRYGYQNLGLWGPHGLWNLERPNQRKYKVFTWVMYIRYRRISFIFVCLYIRYRRISFIFVCLSVHKI